MFRNLIDSIKLIRMKPDGTNYTASAGTSTVTSDSVDTLGFDAFSIQAAFGAIVSGAATSAKIQGSNDNSTFSDIAGSAQTVADTDSGKLYTWDLNKPLFRYYRVVITRGTQNATVDFLQALLHRARQRAVTQPATVAGTKKLNSPGAGTA